MIYVDGGGVRCGMGIEENRQLWVDGEGLRDDYCDGDGDIYIWRKGGGLGLVIRVFFISSLDFLFSKTSCSPRLLVLQDFLFPSNS